MRSRAKLAIIGITVLLWAACGPASGVGPTAAPPATAAPSVVATATPSPATATPKEAASPTPVASPTLSRPSSATPKPGGTVRQYLRRDPSFDTHFIGWQVQSRQVHSLIYNQLVRHQWPGKGSCEIQKVEGDLAKDWRWVDDRTLQVTLQQGVKFQDVAPVNGREMTADDVVYSFRRWLTGTTPAQGIIAQEAVEALDRYTVRFRSSEPNPALIPAALALPIGSQILAREAGGSKEDWNSPRSQIGTGPFIMKNYLPGVKVELDKNPSYWKQGLPYVDKVVVLPMPDVATRVAALRSGKVDIVHELPPPYINELRRTNPTIRQTACPWPFGFLAIYATNDKAPGNDVRVRRALSMAIDREALNKSILEGMGFLAGVTVGTHDTALKIEQFPPELRKFLEYNPTEAKKLLAEAGYSKGLNTKLTVTMGYGAPYTFAYEAVQVMLTQVGITATIENLEYGRVEEIRRLGKQEGLLIDKLGETTIYEFVSNYRSTIPGDRNKAAVRDPELDKLIDRFMVATNHDQQVELSKQIQYRWADQAYRVLLPDIPTFHSVAPRIQDYLAAGDITALGGLYEKIWVQD